MTNVIKDIHCAVNNRLACSLGLVFGSFVPVAVWLEVHQDGALSDPGIRTALVLGGLAYSCTSVYKWGCSAFEHRVKAAGFCLLVEGCLTYSRIEALSYAALAVLVLVNVVAAACGFAAKPRESRARPTRRSGAVRREGLAIVTVGASKARKVG